jgi:hypothetical protein
LGIGPFSLLPVAKNSINLRFPISVGIRPTKAFEYKNIDSEKKEREQR